VDAKEDGCSGWAWGYMVGCLDLGHSTAAEGMNMQPLVPLYQHLFNRRDAERAYAAILTGEVSGHSDIVAEFEQAFAEYLGVDHAVAVTSGTAALKVALHAVGVGKGDEVIIPSFTIISCALAVIELGARPVLVDVTPDTWIIDVDQLYRAVTPKTKAVIAVDMFGHPTPISDYMRHVTPFKVVEDACESLGASTPVGKCGAVADAGVFSFYYNKLITTGEGGMVTTPIRKIADRARSYRNLYFGARQKFLHTDLGFNFRMNGQTAALGLSQLDRIDEFLAIKRRNARMYRNRLAHNDRIQFQWRQEWAQPAYWMTAITTNLPATVVRRKLAEYGVQTREFFLGLHAQPKLQPYLERQYECPVTDHLYEHGLYLPSGLTLREGQVNYVCKALERVLDESQPLRTRSTELVHT